MLDGYDEISVGTGEASFEVRAIDENSTSLPLTAVTLMYADNGSIVETDEGDGVQVITDNDGRGAFNDLDDSYNYTLGLFRDGSSDMLMYGDNIGNGFKTKFTSQFNASNQSTLNVTLDYIDNVTTGVDFDDDINNTVFSSPPGPIESNYTVWGNQTSEDYNVTFFGAKNESGFNQVFSKNQSRGLYSENVFFDDVGNYSFYLRSEATGGETNTSGRYKLFVDDINPSYSNVQLSPSSEQNATFPVNLSAHLNSTRSFLTDVTLYVNDTLVKSNDTLGEDFIHDKNFEWSYEIPIDYVNSTIQLQYCFNDASSITDETCTEPQDLYVTDGVPPETSNISFDDRFIRSDDTFEMGVESVDLLGGSPNVSVSFFNGTDYVLNLSKNSSEDDIFLFQKNLSELTDPLDEGNYTLMINSTSQSGAIAHNESWVVIDDTAPVVSGTLSEGPVKEGDTITVTADITEEYDHSLDDIDVFADISDDADYSEQLSLEHDSDMTWTSDHQIEYSGDGNLTFNVTAMDLAGNIGFNASNLTVDNTPIFIDVLTPSSSAVYNGTYDVDLTAEYNLSEEPEEISYSFLGEQYALPSGTTEDSFDLSEKITFPGQHVLGFSAEDAVGNFNSTTIYFYADFLFNQSAWISNMTTLNDQLSSIDILDENYEIISDEMINITDHSQPIFSFNTSDDRWFNISVYMMSSRLNQYEDMTIQIDNQSFDDNYEEFHGASVLDMFRLGNFDLLSSAQFSMEFQQNETEFETVYVCRDDYLDCSMIEMFDPDEDQDHFYYGDDDNTILNFTSLSFEKETSFLLVNDTAPPNISIVSENQSFHSPDYPLLNLTLNENSTCSFEGFNSTDHSLGTGTLDDLTKVDQEGYENYVLLDFALPGLRYSLGENTLDFTCLDNAENEATESFTFDVLGEPAPSLEMTPSSGHTFPTGTETVELEVDTSPHNVICKVNQTDDMETDFIGDEMASSDGYVHDYNVTGLSDGDDEEYYVRCVNGVGNSTTGLFNFEVDSEDTDDTDDTDGTDDTDDDSTSSDGGDTVAVDDSEDEEEDDGASYASEEFSFSDLEKNEMVEVETTDEELTLSSLKFMPKENVSDAVFLLESFTDMDLFSQDAAGLTDVYRYIQITETSDLEFSSLSNFTMKFRVPESWIEDNSLDDESVLIGAFDEEKGDWDVLSKEYDGTEDGHRLYTAEARAANLFAISKLDEDVQAPEEDEPSGSIVRDDEEDDLRSDLEQRSMSFDEVIKIVSIIVGVIFLSAIVYGNKDYIVKSRERKKKRMAVKPKKRRREKHSSADSDDLRDQNTKDYESNDYGSYGELKELPLPSQRIDIPREDILRNYIETLYRNVWIKGYNDKSIHKEFEKRGWSRPKILEALAYLKVDAAGSLSAVSDPDKRSLVEGLRKKIISKYGFPANGLFTTLKSKGWPSYMIKSAMDTVATKMNVPLHGQIDHSQLASRESYEEYDTSELEDYIKKASDEGVAREEILKRVIDAGWPEKVVEKVLSKCLRK
ncbi:MAG: PGF-pre-PGF domain-containing protein [Candidatus Woesearchaeota archaeon]